jgi:O-antigen/teichoic acid export membrane protein
MFAQSVNSLSNLMVAIVVARTLGPSGLGHFALLFTLLLTLLALQSAWVGDSLTVLDRLEPRIRRGIANSQWIHMLVGMLVGGFLAYDFGGIGVVGTVVFAAMVGTWELEEYGRRMFMARLEFWKQAANDGSYLVITAACLIACAALATITLTAILCCMTIGAFGAFLLGVIWLPPEERLHRPSLTTTGLHEVSRYGFWRGAQSGSGYASQVIVRTLVIGLASATVLGQIEAARLVVAPLFTFAGALTNVTLASFARSVKAKRPVSSLIGVTIIGCGAICVVYGAFVFAVPGFLTHFLVGARFHTDTTALAGWLLVAMAVALSTPFTSLALVIARSSAVFRLRLIGSLVEVVLTVAVLAALRPSLMPACLAAGTALSGVLVWRLARAASASAEHGEGSGGSQPAQNAGVGVGGPHLIR